MKNIIAKSKTTDLIIQVTYMDKHIIRGQVIVGDTFNKVGAVDYWSTSTLDIKGKDMNIPKHYNNDNGSLYSFAEQHSLNSWEFDAIKRIVRSRKKGSFEEDIKKTIVVLELYLNEYKVEKL